MTISSTPAVDMDIDRICRRAMQLAGFLTSQQGSDDPAWAAQASMARDFLEADVEHLQSVGVMRRAVAFYDITTVAGTESYDMPSSTLDVLGIATFQPSGEDVSTALERIDRDRYMRISDKTTAGRPTMYYPHRSATLSLYVWPVPDEVGTLQVQQHKVLASASASGTATMDFDRTWIEYFQWSLAHKLSVHKGVAVDRLSYMRSMAMQAMDRCKASSARQFAPKQLVLAHRIG